MVSKQGQIQVELVDRSGVGSGRVGKMAAHQPPGVLHRAMSVVLFGPDGRVLLQRRSSRKYHFAGVWANSCCSHPGPGENLIAAAERRVGEELGVSASNLESVGSFTYRASDDVSGLVEYEYDHVVVGTVDGVVSPDPFEVDDIVWVARDRVVSWRPPDGRLAPWADLAHLIALRSLSVHR